LENNFNLLIRKIFHLLY